MINIDTTRHNIDTTRHNVDIKQHNVDIKKQDHSKAYDRIRCVLPSDAEAVWKIETACFPPQEAAGREAIAERIRVFPESFLVAEKDGSIIGFINGCVTEQKTIEDFMFEQTDCHEPEGSYQAIFGLDVHPEHQRRGVAAALMDTLIPTAREKGRKGLILTCKERLIPFYEQFGYRNMGVSRSVHGGAVWYDMILEFAE